MKNVTLTIPGDFAGCLKFPAVEHGCRVSIWEVK